MSEMASVEREITEELLELGEISLGPAEAQRLGLGEIATDLAIAAGGEVLAAVWLAGRRRLTGEPLADYLQDVGLVGGLIRLERRVDAGLRLVVRPPVARLGAAARSMIAPSKEAPAGAGALLNNEPARRRGTSNRFRLRQRDEYAWRDDVGVLKTSRTHMSGALKNRGWDPADAVRLRLEGERLATLDQFDELLAVDGAHIEHMPHQEAAARSVLARMGGRGILADEVGLGKTVEAGLVLKELLLRGLARRVLIICPAPLREQWRDELRDKFDEDFDVVFSGKDDAALSADRIIVTLQLVMRNEAQLRKRFDLVIVDEAHRLSGSGAIRTREVIGQIIAEAPRVLFLSATPVQNNLLELYRLVELLRPGTFHSQGEFRRQFVDERDPRRPVNAPELRQLIRDVVVRTTREQAGVDRVHRMPPQDYPIELTQPERQLYDMLLYTLRHRMNRPGDTMRRRQLALRLTASPQAVSRSALRMAEKEPDGELRRILGDIGHLAGDIQHTSREQTALSIIRKWLDEFGRVLVFTQHTDTLGGLQRLLTAKSIPVTPFHGGMSHSAKSASVAAFRTGQSPVLLSTDAGAEGQNLQASNCVLNYDLPWNPMRVEQRIGRVHRLTQTRDVHIANLFARDTLDEAVYRLLHDKLAMFELLFGQVVTVLGELGGAQESSMEARVLEALYAGSDATMQSRLDQLGAELADARSRATTMMTTDLGLSEWLAQRQEEREQRAAQPQARELLPEAAGKPRRRQKDLERFVRAFLETTGAAVSSPAEDLLTAKLPDDLAEALSATSELHLAFTNAALDHRPDAQLCVVGSEIFDDILETQRERGDLTGSVAELPHVHQAPTTAHDPGVRLVWRRVEPDDSWSARATYRVQEGASSGNQDLVVVDVGDLPAEGDARVPLPDGAELPPGLHPGLLLDAVEGRAVVTLKRRLEQRRAAEQQRRLEQQNTLVGNLENQLATAERLAAKDRGWEARQQLSVRRQQLERAIAAARKPQPAAAEPELRAELLTLELHGSQLLSVVERWEHDNGAACDIRYPWTGDLRDHDLVSEATGEVVTMLTLCADAHVVDADELLECAVCENGWCGACGTPRTIDACAGCARAACFMCRDGGALCGSCREPLRDPSLDTEWELAWRLGGGASLMVGERHAIHVTAAGECRTMVPDSDVQDPSRVRLRAVATSLGLPLSAGLVTSAAMPSAEELRSGALWSDVEQSAWWSTWPAQGSAIEPAAATLLPDVSGAAVDAERALTGLLAGLRARQAAPVPPAVAAVPFTVVRRVDARSGQFRYRELWYEADGGPTPVASATGVFTGSRHEAIAAGRPVAEAQAGPVKIEVDGLHRSYICRLTDGTRASRVFIPGLAGAALPAEGQLARLIAEADLPAWQVLVRHPWRASPEGLEFSTPAPGTEVTRRTETRPPVLLPGAAGEPMVTTISDTPLPEELRDTIVLDDRSLRSSLQGLDRTLRPVTLGECLAVEEGWKSPHGTASRNFLVAPGSPYASPGAPLAVILGDGTETHQDVSVDSLGHFFDVHQSVSCPVCRSVYGPCCGDVARIDDCTSCGRTACGTCRASADVPPTRCARCGDVSCADCARFLTVSPCELCERDTCQSCMDGARCGTCRSLAPVDELPAALAEPLAAHGLTVLSSADVSGSVLVLAGTYRRELAVVDASDVTRWVTAADDAMLPVRIAAARLARTGDVAVNVLPEEFGTPTPHDWLVVERDTGDVLHWAVTAAGRRLAGNFDPPPNTRTDVPDEAMVRSLTAVLGSGTSLPAPAGFPLRRAIRSVPGLEDLPSPVVRVVAAQKVSEDLVAVQPRGLVHRTATGSSSSLTVAEWETPPGPVAWARQGWNPAPEIGSHARLGRWEAVLARVGGHALLGVRRDDQRPVWYAITRAPDDLTRGIVGACVVGPHAIASVSGLSTASSLRGVAIASARLTRREVSYRCFPSSSPESVPPASALSAVAPDQAAAAPKTLADLPAPLAESLARRLGEVEVAKVAIGLAVSDTWQLPDGSLMAVRCLVAPGETQGVVRDAATGEALTEAYVCRSLHTVKAVHYCASCLTSTCGACPDRVAQCGLCGGLVCRRCTATPDGRCHACSLLVKLGVMARGSYGAGWKDAVWHGSAAHVQVTVRRIDNAWTLERWDHTGKLTFPLTGHFLNHVRALLHDLPASQTGQV